MIQEMLGLDSLGYQVFLGGLYGSIAFHIMFFGGIGLMYILFGKTAVNEIKSWIESKVK